MKTKLYSLVIFLMFTVSAFAFPIPDTGITKCYDDTKEIPCPTAGQDFYGQDANYSINPMSYTKLDSTGVALPVTATTWAMVKDNVTGLIWENNSHQSTWDNASTVIAGLNTAKFGGYSDWRLPNMTELGSIVDFSVPYPGPTINTNAFKDTFASFYWSSSAYAYYINYAWGVYFVNGYDYSSNKSYTYYVRAVRAGQSIIRSFDPLVINGDRIVSDNTTGLMWQQDTAKTVTGTTTMVWKDALSYCENLTLGGYTDWRLPTAKELRSIVDYTVYSPAIDTGVFKDTFASFLWSLYWSSSTYADHINCAWGVDFYSGYDCSFDKGNDFYVRAVRSGQSVIGTKPTATTSPATSITSNSATLNGTLNPNNAATTYYFEYGTTTSYGSKTTSTSAGSGSAALAVTANLTGLIPNTTYYFRLVATNNIGTTNGNDKTFTTSTTANTKQLIITFEPNDVKPIWNSIQKRWIHYLKYIVYNPNDFPVEVVAWGQFNACLNNIEECTEEANNFKFWLTSCGEGSMYVPAKGYSCDNHWWNYGYADNGDVTGNYAIWYKDDAGNAQVAISEKLTLRQPSTTGITPPSNLTATATQTGITLIWSHSSAADIASYCIYWDNGTGTINYTTPYATVNYPANTTNISLTNAGTYKFGVRAVNKAGNEEKNTNVVVSITIARLIPNLTTTSLSVPPSLQILTQSTISWNIKNSGQKDAAGSWVDKLYLSSDETLGSDDILLGEFTKSNGLSGDTEYQQTEKINIPKVEPGFYYIILKADSNSTLSESDETDNIFVQPITITTAKLMTATPDRIELNIVAGNTQTGNLQISNISTVDIGGITATVKNAPSNITVQITPPTLLKSLTSQTITYTVKAVDDSVSTGEITVLFADSQGNEASVLFVIKVLPGTPKLATNPGYLESGMLRGNQRSVEFELSNIGGASANNLKIAIPQASWLKLVTPDNIGTLAAGSKTNVILMLKPSNDMVLGPYTGEIVVSGSNANLRVGFKFTAVSDAKGNLKVIAEDEFTYFAEDKPNVAGAEVLVKDAFDNSKVIAQGITDSTGIFLINNINEGRYDIEVRGEKHASYHSTVEIVAGMTKVVRAFMKRQLVSYKWTLEPIEIEDKYQVVLEAEFETHVPAPVVVVEPRTQVALIPEGGTGTVNVTVTNHGLIAAQGVTLNFADNDKYEVQPLIKDIGLLPAMTSVVVPVSVRAKTVSTTRSGVNGTTRSASTGDQVCDFLSGKAISFYYCGDGAVWREATFSLKPLEVKDLVNCLGADVITCFNLACSKGEIDPCVCMIGSVAGIIKDIGTGTVFGLELGLAKCIMCGTWFDSEPPKSSNGGGGGGGGSGISGPPSISTGLFCDIEDYPGFNQSAKMKVEAAPSDISRYGGKIVRYKVTGK